MKYILSFLALIFINPLVSSAQNDQRLSDIMLFETTDGINISKLQTQPNIFLQTINLNNINEIEKKLIEIGLYPTGELEGYVRSTAIELVYNDSARYVQMLFPALPESFRIPQNPKKLILIKFYPILKDEIGSLIKSFELFLREEKNDYDDILNYSLMMYDKIISNQIYITPEYLDEIVTQGQMALDLVNKLDIKIISVNEKEILNNISHEAKQRAKKTVEKLSGNNISMLESRRVIVKVRSPNGRSISNAKVYMQGMYSHMSKKQNQILFGISDPAYRSTNINCGGWYFWAKMDNSTYEWEPEFFSIPNLTKGEDKVIEIKLQAK